MTGFFPSAGEARGENACDEVFGWAAQELGRVKFARQAGQEAGSGWKPVAAAKFASDLAR